MSLFSCFHGRFVVPNGFGIPGIKGGTVVVVGLEVVVSGVLDVGSLVDVSLVDGNVVNGVVEGTVVCVVLPRAVRNQ